MTGNVPANSGAFTWRIATAHGRASAIIERLAGLTEHAGAVDTARSLARAAAELSESPQDGVRTIAAMYGGMGSLNDVVLYRDGQPLAAENREFDALRSELFDLSLELRGAG